MLKIGAAAAACFISLAAIAAPDQATAGIIFSTADYTGIDTGEYVVSDDRYFGVGFTLDATTQIRGIGGQFGGFPSGTIFGAIVPLPTATSLPSFTPSEIEADSLAHVVFSAPSATTDLTVPLSITLNAGSYGLVFGSGAFGADGAGGLGDGNNSTGSPAFFTYLSFDLDGNSWETASMDGARFTITGAPEASTWMMMTAGFVGLGLLGHRASRKRGAAIA
jgi:hypothetical protein